MMYLQVGGDLEEIILFKKYHHFNTWKARSPAHDSNIITEQLREMETREPEDSEPRDQDLVFLVLVASLLCLLTGWCLFHGCIFYQEILIMPRSLGGESLFCLGPGPK